MTTKLIAHFGCRGKPGHHLTLPNGRSVRDFEADKLLIPRENSYDGAPTFLPFPEKVGIGALTYLPANNRTILAWWDRTFDGRPGCNMALIGDGYGTAQSLWDQFNEAMPMVAKELKMPEIVKAKL